MCIFMSLKNEAVLDIVVQPKSSRSRITIQENIIKVYLNSPPVDGKANDECIALFSKTLRIPKSAIEIGKGEKGRRKKLLISGITREEIIEKLITGI